MPRTSTCRPLASAEAARLLKVAAKSPIFIALRRARDQTGAPIELSHVTMLPVPLDISVRHAAFVPQDNEAAPPKGREWTYTVGFGDFQRLIRGTRPRA